MCTDASSDGLTGNILRLFVFIEITFRKTKIILRPLPVILEVLTE